MTTDPAEPPAERIVERGGWHRDDAVVLSIAIDQDVAVVLVAGNGLGYEMEIELWRQGEDWEPDCSFGLPPTDDSLASGGTDDCCFAAGVVRDPESRQVASRAQLERTGTMLDSRRPRGSATFTRLRPPSLAA